jgi:hypothetical protein
VREVPYLPIRSYHAPAMTWRAALAVAIAGGLLAAAAHAAEGDHVVRANGVQLTAPDGWSRVEPPSETASADPRTLLVVGTKGTRAIDTDCQVSSYRVPADGAVVVVVGWRPPSSGVALLPVTAMRLRRETFECFAGRGAVGQLARGGRDFQVNVMVGDRAETDVVATALAVARSFALAQRG